MGEQLFDCHGRVERWKTDGETFTERRCECQFALFDELADGDGREQLTTRGDAETGRCSIRSARFA